MPALSRVRKPCVSWAFLSRYSFLVTDSSHDTCVCTLYSDLVAIIGLTVMCDGVTLIIIVAPRAR